jgi:minor histocompatibility antigen H13
MHPPQKNKNKIQDAMKFPLIGSAVLVSLFAAFRFLPRHLVNAALTLYFVCLGTVALAATVLPFVEAAFPPAVRARAYTLAKGLRIPYALPDPTDVEVTLPEAVAGCAAAAGCAWYGFRKHWLANNALGLAFSLTGIEHLSLGSVSTGAILLGGLFVYDVFWVFCTPVMVSVAKAFDAPIKLLFPRTLAAARGVVVAKAAAASAASKTTASTAAPFSMLGLGDIVIPGIFVALLLRFDRSPARVGKPSYFRPAFGGYVGGLATTIAVMNAFQAAQPALLYIVPAVLGCVGVAAVVRGEVAEVLAFSEEEEEEKEGGEGKTAAKSPSKKATPKKTK